MTYELDNRLRNANFIDATPDVPPIGPLLDRLDDHRPRRLRRRQWRHPAIALAFVLGAGGTATVVKLATGPSTALDAKASTGAPAVSRITGLIDRFDPHWDQKIPRATGTVGSLGDAGPITGTTVYRDGFDIEIATDTKTLCDSAHPADRPVSGMGCTTLPIPYDAIPFASASDGPQPTRKLYYAIAPDGVTDLTVTGTDGTTRHADFIDNVAAVTFQGDDIGARSWSWTLLDGRRATQRPGGFRHVDDQ